jgi:hypothetical protein
MSSRDTRTETGIQNDESAYLGPYAGTHGVRVSDIVAYVATLDGLQRLHEEQADSFSFYLC